MIDAIFEYQFMQNAVIASFLASIVCGIIGVVAVEKQLVMMGGGIAHTAYGGVGLAYLLGFNPMIGAGLFSIGAAFGIGYVRQTKIKGQDTVIALFWSLGMALGILFIGFMPGYPPDLTSYLFGNILSVTRDEIKFMALMTALVCLIIGVFFQDWKAYLFDQEFAKINGLKTGFFEYLLLVLIALTAVTMIRLAGIILVIALLTAPASTAAFYTKTLKMRMLYAVIISLFDCFSGLTISYYLNIPSGATIIMVSVAVYALATAHTRVKVNKLKLGN